MKKEIDGTKDQKNIEKMIKKDSLNLLLVI